MKEPLTDTSSADSQLDTMLTLAVNGVIEHFDTCLQFAREKGTLEMQAKVLRFYGDALRNSGQIEFAEAQKKEYYKIIDEIYIQSESRLKLLRDEFIRMKEKKESELLRIRTEQLERELIANVSALVAQTELLGKFRDDLRSIVREITVREPAVLRLKEKLKELPCSTINWLEYDRQFMEVHPHFRALLQDKYPALSTMEMKICSFIRLKLTRTDMSLLLCISERTVDTHRYNIRKKIGITADQDLFQMLTSIA